MMLFLEGIPIFMAGNLKHFESNFCHGSHILRAIPIESLGTKPTHKDPVTVRLRSAERQADQCEMLLCFRPTYPSVLTVGVNTELQENLQTTWKGRDVLKHNSTALDVTLPCSNARFSIPSS
jgi:hypothetical protein